jgi:hypothetical protein
MSVFTGIKCDSCGQVVEVADRTRKKTCYDGPTVSGEFTQDLCPECTPKTESLPRLRPLRRRKARDEVAVGGVEP